jgi:hypothetical protein
MAKVRLNPIISGLHGKIGDMIFRASGTGETVVYLAPDKLGSEKQSGPGSPPHPFDQAHAYAREAMADPEMQLYYQQEAKRTGKKPYFLAFQNYFKVRRKLGE